MVVMVGLAEAIQILLFLIKDEVAQAEVGQESQMLVNVEFPEIVQMLHTADQKRFQVEEELEVIPPDLVSDRVVLLLVVVIFAFLLSILILREVPEESEELFRLVQMFFVLHLGRDTLEDK